MQRLAWMTDLHLDFVEEGAYAELLSEIRGATPDLLLLTGDIANGEIFTQRLEQLQSELKLPLYFVLGNHDYYGREIEDVRDEAASLECATYLTTTDEPIALAEDIALVGHDGWADAGEGDFFNSFVRLRDYNEILDFQDLPDEELYQELAALGSDAAQSLREKIKVAAANYPQVIVATHPPPFREACLYQDREATDDWAPHFVSSQVGDMLKQISREYPATEFLVLCGHSHHVADYRPKNNLRVRVGHADYGTPHLQELLTRFN